MVVRRTEGGDAGEGCPDYAAAMPSALDRLRDHLLPKTLEHAVKNSAFYAEHLGDGWPQVQCVAGLHQLPILDKETAVEHQEAMRCGGAPEDFGAVSSGTTRVGDRLFRVERSPDELAALDDFRRMLADARPPSAEELDEELDEAPPRVLHVLTPNHGLPSSPPAAGTQRLAWSSSRNIVDMIAQALSEEREGRPVTVLRISISALKQLTLSLLEAGDDFGRFHLEAIGTNAALVTSRWRALLEEVWGCRVFDNYSLSEFVTPATECEACGWYHFGEPPLVVELVDPLTSAPLPETTLPAAASGDDERCIGHLLLTGLYPYVQRTPLIRYATGDLVERGPYCEAADDVGLRFVGRVRHSLLREREGATEILLLPPVIEDAIDALPEVARHRHPFDRLERVTPYQVGQPKLAVALDEGAVTVRVGVLFQPALFAERARSLTEQLRELTLRAHPALAKAVDAGELALNIALEPAFDDDASRWMVKYLM